MNETQVEDTVLVEVGNSQSDSSSNITNPRFRKSFLIIISSLVFLIFCVGGYLLCRAYLQKNITNINTEDKPSINILTISLNDEYDLVVKHSLLTPYDEPFILDEKDKFSESWKAIVGPSSIYYLGYASDEENLSNLIAHEKVVYPLKKVTINGLEYKYIWQVNGSGTGNGAVYRFNPKIQIKGYEASKVLHYYNASNPNTDFSLESSYVYTQSCVFSLAQLNKNISGYIIFRGSSASELDYCEVLNNTEIFEMIVE